jgi:hypothetical protein
MSLPEAVIQRVLIARLDALRRSGAPIVFDRINVTVARTVGRFVRSAPNGHPDLHGAVAGRAVAIEVKSKTGTQSPAQIAWQEAWEAAGGVYLISRDVDATIALILSMPGARP